MTNLEQNIEWGEASFKRVLNRVMDLPGRVEVGRTCDTHDKYIVWYPCEVHDSSGETGPEHKVYVRWVLYGDFHGESHRGNLEMDSNLSGAAEIK